MTLRPSLKDIEEELAQMAAEQSAVNESVADKRQKDQALLEQMLPPQVCCKLHAVMHTDLDDVEMMQTSCLCLQVHLRQSTSVVAVLP